MRKLALPCLIVFGLLFSGCYGTKVTTGLEKGSKTVTKRQTGFVNGLVMQNMPIDGTNRCPNGVAAVKTELTVLDQLLASFTGGIYSPITVSVTCAAGSMSSTMPAPDVDFTVPEDAPKVEVKETITAAAEQSAERNESVRVQFSN